MATRALANNKLLSIMKHYEETIDKESETALQQLAKSSIQFLYSPSADVCFGSSIITVQSISIQIGKKKFVVIDNDWTDTRKEWHDYYFLRVRISDRPRNVTVKESDNGENWPYVMDHLSFHIGKLKKISSVIVLEHHYSGQEEQVRYDAGIVIILNDGVRISIVREESIAGFLQISTDQQENVNLVEGLQKRVKYTALDLTRFRGHLIL